MTLILFSIHDNKADTYTPPFAAPSRGVMIRNIQDVVSEGKTPHSKHPDDYELFELGTWDDVQGTFSIKEYQSLGTVAQLTAK